MPDVAALHGQWRSDWATAGLLARYTRLRFDAVNTLALDTVNFDHSGQTNYRYDGSYALMPRGTVKYAWGDDAHRIEAENSLTFVEGRALDLGHPCCARASGRWWTHRGYLSDSPARTRFSREALRRELDASGLIASSRRIRVELTFPAAPSELVRGGACSLDVLVRIELIEAGSLAERDFRISLECTARQHAGLSIILIPGWDWVTIDDRSLAESPYQAASLWRRMLDEQPDLQDWPEPLMTALKSAFEPYLVFDEQRPDLLFHYLDTNAQVAEGYAWLGPLGDNAPPARWPFTD